MSEKMVESGEGGACPLVGVEGSILKSGKEEDDPTQNPLMTDAVLMTLFDLCELSDLLKYRLVSRQWYFLSLPRIRNEVTLRFDYEFPRSSSNDLNWNTTEELFQMVAEDTVPFKRFRIFLMDFLTSPPPSTPQNDSFYTEALAEKWNMTIEEIYKNMELFWGTFGQFITKLELLQCTVYSADSLKKTIFEYTPNLKELRMDFPKHSVHDVEIFAKDEVVPVQANLKFLFLKDYGEDGEEIEDHVSRSKRKVGRFPIPFLHLFLKFAKIQKLQLLIFEEDVTSPMVEAYESFDEIPLKDLKLIVTSKQPSASVENLFRLGKLKLEKLEINLIGSIDIENGKSILRTALSRQGDNLKELRVRSWETDLFDKSNPTNNFPFRREPLENLTRLLLEGYVYQNCKFLEKTPNLRVLHVKRQHKVRGEIELGPGTTLPFLKELFFDGYYDYGYLSWKEMQAFVEAAPNVEHFEGDVDSSAFRVICSGGWNKLRVLDIISKDINDKVLTGLKKDGSGDEVRLPNITDLKYLTTFHCRLSRPKIGVSCIWSGFLKMPQLRTLSVRLLPTNEKKWMKGKNRKAVEAMWKHIPDSSIIGAVDFTRRRRREDEDCIM